MYVRCLISNAIRRFKIDSQENWLLRNNVAAFATVHLLSTTWKCLKRRFLVSEVAVGKDSRYEITIR